MKKICCLLLIALMLSGIVGCSGEPIDFSKASISGRECYIDVVEIKPYSVDSYDFYCECTLENGQIVWMSIYDDEYFEYFSLQSTDDSLDTPFPKSVKYDKPIRLMGKTKYLKDADSIAKIYNYDENGGEKIKVFSFGEADLEATQNSTEQYYGASCAFYDDTNEGVLVYADIVRINPSQYLGTYGYVSELICSCETESGETFSANIKKRDYEKYFSKETEDAIDFATPVRIYGAAVKKDYSPTSEGVDFGFYEADAEAISAAKIENQPAVEFSGSHKPKQKVFAKIKSITPEFSVTDLLRPLATSYFLCRCELVGGGEVWLYMSSSTFEKDFANTFIESDWSNSKIELDNVTVHGTVKNAEDIEADLADKIGTEIIVEYNNKK